MKIKDEQFILEILNETFIKYEDIEYQDGVVVVTITGDWKHTHGYFENLMQKNGYKIVSCKEVGNSDSDWYTAQYKVSK